MSTFLFKKVPGGAKMQKQGRKLEGIYPFEIVFVDLNASNTSKVEISLRGHFMPIDVTADVVTIDLTAIGGTAATFDVNTLTGEQLQDKIMNVFNPFSNLITP